MKSTEKNVKTKEKTKNVKTKEKTKAKVIKEPFLKSVHKEMKLVKWPTWKDVIKNTIATVVMCIILVGFFLLLNAILAMIKGWFV